MRFLADAHISTELVAMIRELGHDCSDASSIPSRMPDLDVLKMAVGEGRIVVTADKDFGELVFVHAIPCPGVILIRVTAADELDRVAQVRAAWPTALSRLPGSFVTIASSGAVRVRPIR
ncbi:MAG: DUF5615 family PIN-like protein [Tepidisphaeraceae bacterium]